MTYSFACMALDNLRDQVNSERLCSELNESGAEHGGTNLIAMRRYLTILIPSKASKSFLKTLTNLQFKVL